MNKAVVCHFSKLFRAFSLVIVIILALFVITFPIWFPVVDCYLDVSQPPQQADVIIVLGGGNGSRERHAARLYHQGYAPLMIISGHRSTMGYGLEIIAEEEVPQESVLINDKATTTYNEAEQVLAMLLEIQATSALIVTNRSHTRRAMATYNQVFDGQGIMLRIVAPNDPDQLDWFSDRHRQVLIEYPKMFYYWLVYGVWSG